jgi:hypothetical protein
MPRSEPKRHPLDQSRFYMVQSRAKLAELFGLTRATLDEVLAIENPYSKRMHEEKRKRNGKVKIRPIQEPRGPLRPIHVVVRKALSRIAPPDFLFCPVKRRSYVSNAAQHAGAKEVRTLDVQAYFASTPRVRVYWFFHKIMRCSEDVASIIAQLLTVDGHLATGSTVSPILAFFAFNDMWLEIARIAKEASSTLTVYMDDMTVSGERVPDRVMWEIKKQIHCRALNYHKEHRYAGGIGEVTGTLLRKGLLLVPNRQRKKAYETRMELGAASDPEEIERLTRSLRGLNLQRLQVESRR